MTNLLKITLILLTALLLFVSEATAAPTSTHLVNVSTDLSDLDLSNPDCDVNTSPGLQCSLRAAIEQANHTAGADTINFSDVARTIQPDSELPTITEELTISGITGTSASCPSGPGGAADLLITIDGSNAGSNADGLAVNTLTNDVTIRGLVIVNFGRSGLSLSGNGHQIRCNHIGIEANGITAGPNDDGIIIESGSDNVVIGGSALRRNVISGNVGDGITIKGDGAQISANFIGTRATGSSAVPNRIGVDLTSTANDNVIGESGAGNTIAHNDFGVANSTNSANGNNAIRFNKIYGNTFEGISSRDAGVALDYVDSAGDFVFDTSDLDYDVPFTIDIYSSNTDCSATGGEARTHLLAFEALNLPGNTLEFGLLAGLNANFVSFTLTNEEEGTSSFGNCMAVSPALHVNTLSDDADNNVGDGVCDTSVAAGETCTLRAAFQEINAAAATLPSVVYFDFASPQTIALLAPLPAVTAPVTLDLSEKSSFVCPGESAPSMWLELDGSSAGVGADGIRLGNGSDGSTITGVAIVGFDGDGVQIASGDNRVECNFIGLVRTGNGLNGNGERGIFIASGDGNVIDDTVVVASGSHGVQVDSAETTTITQSYIGVRSNGGAAVNGNGGDGVRQTAGTLIVDRGVIGRNQQNGITSAGVLIIDNQFGSPVNIGIFGSAAIGNNGHGIELANNTVASIIHTAKIANNGGAGIRIQNSREKVSIGDGANIFNNGGLGIDLGGQGVTPNDAVPDVDTGANELQNFPTIIAADPGPNTVTVTLESVPNNDYRIDFYSNDDCDPSGYGEGANWLASNTITTSASGTATQVFTATGYTVNNFLTATATKVGLGLDGSIVSTFSTSEFSPCFEATQSFIVNSTLDDSDSNPNDKLCLTAGGVCTLRAAIEQANTSTGGYIIEFATLGMTIQPASALPVVLKPVTIIGVTDAGTRTIDEPLTVIDGGNSGAAPVLRLGAGSDGSSVSGLALVNGADSGLVIDSNNNRIHGNRFGTDADENNLGNNGAGVLINGDNNMILANVSYHNAGTGVAVLGQGNTLSLNSIWANDALGINLGTDNITPNDPNDADSGANGLQNFPVLMSVTANSAEGTLEVGSDPTRGGDSYQIELFGVETCDAPGGHGEGKVFLGATVASGVSRATIPFTITPNDSMCMPFVAATATNLATGDTSEFSSCVAVDAGTPTFVGVSEQLTVSSKQSKRALILAVIMLSSVALVAIWRRRLVLLVMLPLLLFVARAEEGLAQSAIIEPAVTCGDTFQSDGTLTNEGAVEDESGLIVGAVVGTLDAPVDMELNTVSSAPSAYDGAGTRVGSYFEIVPRSDIVTPDDAPLIVAVPLPAGVDGNNVLAAILHDAADTLDGNGGWSLTVTHFDADDDMLLFALYGLDAGGVVFTLAESAEFSPITDSSRTRSSTVAYQPYCPIGCTNTNLGTYADDLLSAHNNFVTDHGFNPPALQNDLLRMISNNNQITFEVEETTIYYGVQIKPNSSCVGYDGIYNPNTNVMEVCFTTTPLSARARRALRHELFHAIQYAYPAIERFPDWEQEWVMEGTASLAENTTVNLHRTERDLRDVTRSLIQVYAEDSGLLAYEGQDFWYHALDSTGWDFNFLASVFEIGIEPADVDIAMGDLKQLYWEWARDQAYEHFNELDGAFVAVTCQTYMATQTLSELKRITVGGEMLDHNEPLTLWPLDSGWIDITLEDVEGTVDVKVSVTENGGGQATHYIAYDQNDPSCFTTPEGERTITGLYAENVIFVLVSNTDFSDVKDYTVNIEVLLGE